MDVPVLANCAELSRLRIEQAIPMCVRMRIVVTGANRGIGLALARHFAGRGHQVHGTAREPATAKELASISGVQLHGLDVRSDESCAALAKELSAHEQIDVLINNTGVGDWAGLSEFDAARAIELFDANALGPLRVTRALLPLLTRSRGKVFHMSSGMGSISNNDRGGAYAYRMSKAALGMAAKSLAIDLRGQGIASIVIEPGWVRTDMGGSGGTISPEESAAELAHVIETRGIESTGRFFSRKNVEVPW